MNGKKNAQTDRLLDSVIEGIIRKKGRQVTTLFLENIENAICSYFVITHGDSTTQTGAIGESVEEVVKEHLNEKPLHREGYQNAHWILLDYGDVIVHIFQESFRELYNLEDLWADAESKLIEEAV